MEPWRALFKGIGYATWFGKDQRRKGATFTTEERGKEFCVLRSSSEVDGCEAETSGEDGEGGGGFDGVAFFY